eukprot:3417639-Rhodomonas_salina.2
MSVPGIAYIEKLCQYRDALSQYQESRTALIAKHCTSCQYSTQSWITCLQLQQARGHRHAS